MKLPTLLLALPLAAPVAAGDLPSLQSVTVTGGLLAPVSLAHVRGDTHRIFVVEQGGAIRVVQDGVLQVEPYLDVQDKIVWGGERGLLGLAFHPDFALNGRMFVYYTDLNGDGVLEEYSVADPVAGAPDPDSGTILLTVPQPLAQHNGATLAFGPSGYLHVSTGDGGGGGDPFGNAQSIDTLLGKILRIDVDSATPYGIPPTNPLVGVPGAAEEIYVWGLRNPWRYAIDGPTGDLYITDVGQALREEIDYVPGGSGGMNFGWPCLEGNLCYAPSECCDPGAYSPPIHEYDHSTGCAITGGLVYRGTALDGMQGRFLFADYCVGRIWSLRYDGGPDVDLVEHTTELGQGGFGGLITAMGQDGSREPYYLVYTSGQLRKIVPGEEVPDCDGDGTSDAEAIASGASFDVNGNGLPDECELLLEVGLPVPGEELDFSFIGAAPGLPVATFYSFRGIGQGPCLLPDLCLDLLPFNVFGEVYVPVLTIELADAQGQAAFTLTVPPNIDIPLVAFQAVVLDGLDSVKSNPVQKVKP